MSVDVIIPTFNRLSNLQLVLAALARQSVNDFEVVVADDGSVDGTRQAVEALMNEDIWRRRLRWVGCGVNQGMRPARTRNIGAANLPASCTFMVMLDSDSLIEEHTIERFATLHQRHPRAVIMGMTEWLPPLSYSEIERIQHEQGTQALRSLVPAGPPHRVEGTFVGPELRMELEGNLFTDQTDDLRRLRPEWSLPLNSGYPLELFRELGGFDEGMVGYGYEDIELGVRAYNSEVQCLLYSEIWSLHIWHAKVDPQLRSFENQKNLDYLLRKHGAHEVLEREIDWAYWRHYHRQRGGRVIMVEGTLWAINQVGTHRLRLPKIEWVERLGFFLVQEVQQLEQREIEAAADMGTAAETAADESDQG